MTTAQLTWVPISLGVVGVGMAAALGLTIYLVIRGEYLRLPDDKPGSELDALTRLLGSFARFSVRSRRIIRALAAALVLDFLLSAAYGGLAYEFEANRCVPYTILNRENTGSRHLWDNFVLARSKAGPNPPSPALVAAFEAELRRDYPDVRCP